VRSVVPRKKLGQRLQQRDHPIEEGGVGEVYEDIGV
jgi:hypothetical protein